MFLSRLCEMRSGCEKNVSSDGIVLKIGGNIANKCAAMQFFASSFFSHFLS